MYIKIKCRIKSRYGVGIVEGNVISAENRGTSHFPDWHVVFIDINIGKEIYFNQSEDTDMKLIEIKD